MKTFDRLKYLVEEALKMLYQYDNYLIENDLHEQCIVFRFGLYLYKLIQKTIYADLDLDLEYNKNIDNLKLSIFNPNGIRPDLILHKRGNNDNNILVLEFKKTNGNTKNDFDKLKEFTNISSDYKYRHGGSILLAKKMEHVKITWFELK